MYSYFLLTTSRFVTLSLSRHKLLNSNPKALVNMIVLCNRQFVNPKRPGLFGQLDCYLIRQMDAHTISNNFCMPCFQTSQLDKVNPGDLRESWVTPTSHNLCYDHLS